MISLSPSDWSCPSCQWSNNPLVTTCDKCSYTLPRILLSLIVGHSYIVIVYHFLNCVVYFSDASSIRYIFLFICLYACDLNYS